MLVASEQVSKKGRPSKPAKGQKPSVDARELLIGAARQKFISKPYDKVSIRELSQLAGVNSAMIKYYFENKEGLYKAMILEVTGQVITSIKQHLKSGSFDSLEGFFRSFVEMIKESPEFPLLMLKEMILNQGVCREYFIETMGHEHMKVFDEVYLHFKQSGQLRPNVDRLMFRMSLMSLTLHPWYMRELLGLVEGVTYDDAFLETLINHNTQLMQFGLFESQNDDTSRDISSCIRDRASKNGQIEHD
ncbi:MAG: AcrR family transcriptional regulator [Phenylobacterium sp.]|jgi:AcrR family transcriptional regulator